jgi:ubiquinol-cytochrome c reductase cytochrome b subunit
LHDQGSTDPCVHAKHVDVIRFYPYFYYKDIFGLFLILILFSIFVFFNQDYLGHPDNYVKANPLVTPKHIVPEWYFLPFYGLLRSIPNKFAGIALMLGAIVFLLLLPIFISNKSFTNEYRGYSYGLWS